MYLKYFGFREFPFSVTPDPKFFFDSSLHREAWASLFYGIKEKKGFVVVTGEVGTGKTLLLRKALRSLDATHQSVLIFNTRLTFDELLETILRDLGIDRPGAGRVAQLESLNDFLLEKVKAGQIVSILIDEAQNLSDDTLEGVRLLSNLETDREKLLQIILAGQPELEFKLNARSLRQLKQRVSLWCRLDCLNRSDTEAYIRHRLQVAQYQGPAIFPETTVQAIWELTSGIPRLINVVCDNSLLTAFATSQKIVSVDMIREVARDLKIIPDARFNEHLAAEAVEPTQALRVGVGSVVPMARDVAEEASRHNEDRERPRLASVGASAVTAEGLANSPRRWPELREARRDYGRPVPAGNFRNEKRSAAEINPDGSKIFQPAAPASATGGAFAGASRLPDGGSEDTTLPASFLDRVGVALTEAMGPMAPFVVKSVAAALGESLDRFPAKRMQELLLRLKSEILSEGLREAFEAQIAKEIDRHVLGRGR